MPNVLPLTDIVLDTALQVRPVSDKVAEEYAEHLEALPPAAIWDVDGRYLLGDGWHRHRAHQLAGATHMRVVIFKGTIEQAKLYIAMCDLRVGVRRDRAAKRKAVLLVLGTEKGREMSDRKIGEHCGVSHTFVGLVRARISAGVVEEVGAGSGRAAADTGDAAEVGGGNVATQVADGAPEDGAVKDDVAAEVTPSGNVATSPGKSVVDRGRHLGMDAGATAARERGRSRNVATDADAAPAEEDQQAVPEPETEATADEQGDEDSPDADADAPGVLEGDADLANASLFGDADRVTVGDVVREVGALLAACDDDAERRDALGQLLDALTGMLATFDEGDLADDAQDLDAE